MAEEAGDAAAVAREGEQRHGGGGAGGRLGRSGVGREVDGDGVVEVVLVGDRRARGQQLA